MSGMEAVPLESNRSGFLSRFRQRSLSTSPSSSSSGPDAGSPSSRSRHAGPIVSSRLKLLSVDVGSLKGKAASSPSMVPPPPPQQQQLVLEGSALLTPRHLEVLPFATPEDRSNGSAADGDSNATTTEGDTSKGGFKRGFKRVLQGVPSPSHFHRSMSFSGSMSAISSAANRVASGAMTPIRLARHRRRENRENSEGSGISVADGETPSRRERGFGSPKPRSSRSAGGSRGAASSKAGSGSSRKNGTRTHKRGKTSGLRRA
ncbi:unnamed protein product, partial [Pylaiella littoralis]